MKDIKLKYKTSEYCEILICGGDDILIKFKDVKIKKMINILRTLQKEFYKRTGCTISGGVATDLDRVLNSLGFAKKFRKGSLYIDLK